MRKLLLHFLKLLAAPPADSGVWFGPSSSMYRPGCSPVSGLHGFWCLSVTGWTFQLCTWIGFALMVTGAARCLSAVTVVLQCSLPLADLVDLVLIG